MSKNIPASVGRKDNTQADFCGGGGGTRQLLFAHKSQAGRSNYIFSHALWNWPKKTDEPLCFKDKKCESFPPTSPRENNSNSVWTGVLLNNTDVQIDSLQNM